MLRAFPVVMCPGCKTEMEVVSQRPVDCDKRFQEILYRCPNCGTETVRQVTV